MNPEIIAQYAIRTCARCTAWVANHRRYGRLPHRTDPTLCECCEYDDLWATSEEA